MIIVAAVLLQQRIAERSAPSSAPLSAPLRTPDSLQHPDQGGSSCPHPCAAAGSRSPAPPPRSPRRPRLYLGCARGHLGRRHGRRNRPRHRERRIPATPSPSASPLPPPTTAGWARSPKPRSRRAGELRRPNLVQAEATNDVNLQISQVEQFINDGVVRSCCCRSTAPRSPRSRRRPWRPRHRRRQRGPRVRRPERRPHDGPRRQLRHGRERQAPHHLQANGEHRRREGREEIAGIDSLPAPRRTTACAASRRARGLRARGERLRVAADFYTVQAAKAAPANLLQAAPRLSMIWTTTTTRVSASSRRSSRPRRSSSWSAAPAQRTRSRPTTRCSRRRSSTRRRRPPTASRLARLLGSRGDERPRRGQCAPCRRARQLVEGQRDQYLPTAFES